MTIFMLKEKKMCFSFDLDDSINIDKGLLAGNRKEVHGSEQPGSILALISKQC